MNEIVFIAVNYNNSSYSEKFVKSVNELYVSVENVSIIIVDNNSDANDWKRLKAYLDSVSNVKTIRNSENLGYFRALNEGIKCIENKSEALIIICNNDLEFRKDFLQKLAAISYHNYTLVIAPNVITKNGYNQNPHCINRVSAFRRLCYKLYFTNYYFGKILYWLAQKLKSKETQEIQYINSNTSQFIHMGIGACYVLTPHFFEHFDMLDDSVFLWGEEALLAGQINSVSGKMWYDSEIVVYHNENTSVSKIPSKEAYNITKTSYKTYAKYL